MKTIDLKEKLQNFKENHFWGAPAYNTRALSSGGYSFALTLPKEFVEKKFGIPSVLAARFYSQNAPSGRVNLHNLDLSHISVEEGVCKVKKPTQKPNLTPQNYSAIREEFIEKFPEANVSQFLNIISPYANSGYASIFVNWIVENYTSQTSEEVSEELDFQNDMISKENPGFRVRFRKKSHNTGSEVYNVGVEIVNLITEIFGVSNYYVSSYLQTKTKVNPLAVSPLDLKSFRVPKPGELTDKQISEYLSLPARRISSWVTVYSHKCELDFEERERVLEIVKQELALVPDVEVTDISQRYIMYVSDESGEKRWELTQDAFNHPKFGKKIFENTKMAGHDVSGSVVSPAVIYIGRAWAVHYTVGGLDPLAGNHVLVATEEQVREAFSQYRPDLLPSDWKPWAPLMYIANPQWCERNGSHNYHRGYDLSSPMQRRNSLLTWTLGSLASRYREKTGSELPGIMTTNGVSNKAKLAKLEQLLK